MPIFRVMPTGGQALICVFLEMYGIPYMKKSRNSVKFRGISRNYTTRNSAEIRRNFSQFRTEYGIDGSKKNRRNSVSAEFRGHPTSSQARWTASWVYINIRSLCMTRVLLACPPPLRLAGQVIGLCVGEPPSWYILHKGVGPSTTLA
jgi:hypothetical protein